MYYFSYGSNMSTPRLRARTPSARFIDTGLIRAHRLMFHKASLLDGSAKCDAYHTGNDYDVVHGVLFSIEPNEKPLLDKVEGLGTGYDEKSVPVETDNGTTVEAFTYHALRIANDLKPFTWYKEHVLRGAVEFDLPPDYVAMIESIEAIADPNSRRHHRELAIYTNQN